MTKKTERNDAVIKARVEDGLKLCEIAEKFGITKQRVSQILRAHGIGGRDYVYLRNEDRLYNFIVKYKMEHNGTNPSFREIERNVGSLSVYGYALMIRDRLIKKGKLTSNAPEKITWASIEVPSSMWTPPLIAIEQMCTRDVTKFATRSEFVSLECWKLLERLEDEEKGD